MLAHTHTTQEEELSKRKSSFFVYVPTGMLYMNICKNHVYLLIKRKTIAAPRQKSSSFAAAAASKLGPNDNNNFHHDIVDIVIVCNNISCPLTLQYYFQGYTCMIFKEGYKLSAASAAK